MPKHEQVVFDIAIAGGGATGLALALLLAKQTSLHIVLVEGSAKKRFERTSDAHVDRANDIRSVALSAQSCDLLSSLGLDNLAELGCPIDAIHVSDRGHLGQTVLQARDYSIDVFGRVASLEQLTAFLYQRVADHSQVTVMFEATIENIARCSDSVDITLSNGNVLTTPLLVVAEGGESGTRAMVGIDSETKHYGQTAVVANVELSRDHNNVAYERFTEDGPLALLPLYSQRRESGSLASLVWTLPVEKAQQTLCLSNTEFLDQLQTAFGHRLGTLVNVSERASFPLLLRYAKQHIHHRVALVGNACQTLHPIAGQGLNLALRDVQSLAETIVAQGEHDIGHYGLLSRYQSDRRVDQKRLVAATDTLVSTFSNAYSPLVVGRNLSLLLLDQFTMLKETFALTAMGYSSKKGVKNAKL